jgi:Tol biopolymer transport system component
MRWLICGAFLAINAFAQGDHADPLGGGRWSPDSEWVALNWPGQPELFLISLKTGASFTLRPAGDIQLDGGQVFTMQGSPGGIDLRHTTRTVASFGRDRLTLVEWSPDGKQVAYQATPQTNAIFSVLEESVKRRVAASQPLPWHKPDELRATFELVSTTSNHPASYLMRVQRLDGSTVKQVAFDDPREIHLIPAVRSREVSFLSANGQFVLYPRAVGSNGWQLVRESLVETNAVPQPVTKPTPTEPYQWQLSHDDRLLALVEGGALSIGAVDDWAHARTISLPHEYVAIRWSPDDKFLALLDERSLSVMGRDDDRPKLVTDSCSSRFWGWRGTRLYFGNAVTDLTDLSYVDAEHLASPTRVSARKREWESATREVSLSPDGARLVCLVPETDYAARTVWQLWGRSLQQTNAEWQLMYELKGK